MVHGNGAQTAMHGMAHLLLALVGGGDVMHYVMYHVMHYVMNCVMHYVVHLLLALGGGGDAVGLVHAHEGGELLHVRLLLLVLAHLHLVRSWANMLAGFHMIGRVFPETAVHHMVHYMGHYTAPYTAPYTWCIALRIS